MLSKRRKEIAGVLAVLLFLRHRKRRKSRKGKVWSRMQLAILRRRDCGQYHRLCRELETKTGLRTFVNYCRLTARTVQFPFPRSKSLTRDLSPSLNASTRAFMPLSDWLSNEVYVELRCGCVHISHPVPSATDHGWKCPTGTDLATTRLN